MLTYLSIASICHIKAYKGFINLYASKKPHKLLPSPHKAYSLMQIHVGQTIATPKCPAYQPIAQKNAKLHLGQQLPTPECTGHSAVGYPKCKCAFWAVGCNARVLRALGRWPLLLHTHTHFSSCNP